MWRPRLALPTRWAAAHRGLTDVARAKTIPAAVSAVEAFMRATLEKRAEQLAQFSSVDGAHEACTAAVVASRSGIDAVLAARAVCLVPEYSHNSWARTVNLATLRTLRPLFGPRLTALYQLAWDDSAPQHIRGLAVAARSSETVHAADTDAAWQVKFGERRMVHALAHLTAPEGLLAVIYSALLPTLPASMATIDRDSGLGLSSGAAQWAISGSSPLHCRGVPCRTAVFYSVSSPNPLLNGLGLGRRVLFDVASLISVRRPDVTHFATLSPIPGFVAWLVGAAKKLVLTPEESEAVAAARFKAHATAPPVSSSTQGLSDVQELAWLLTSGRAWFDNQEVRMLLQPCLFRLCVEYLKSIKDESNLPLCPVATFHLRNGAKMARVCWAADSSDICLASSAGLMVNYVYSETGAAGLHATAARAMLFAESPRAVLAAQAPELAQDG